MGKGLLIFVTTIIAAYFLLLFHSFKIIDRRYIKLEREVKRKRQQREIKEGCIKQSLSEMED